MKSIDEYDAITFFSSLPFDYINGIPQKRSHHQIYIYSNLEPPIYSAHNLINENYFYNWTMTYRLDSDIIWSYGSFYDKTSKLVPSSSINLRDMHNEFYGK